jgi:hypothetical protein
VQSAWIAIDLAVDPIEPSSLSRISASNADCRVGSPLENRMLHSDLALQSSSPAIEPLVRRSRTEIIDRYRQFRAISKSHHSGALNFMSKDALKEQARRLGIIRGRRLMLNTEDELPLLSDLVLYARQAGRKRPLDRYASSQRLSPGSDEGRVLDAMLGARFALIRVERRHPEAGLIVTDLMRGDEFWLVDEGMESSFPAGLKLATRVFSPEDFYMASGVFVPLEGRLLVSALARRPVLTRMALEEALGDRRFAEAIYREAIDAGVMERVRFQDPPGLASAAG